RNASVSCGRVEELQVQEKFDGIISRAFAETSDFVSLTRHLLARDGRWAAMKGTPDQELQRLPGDVVVEQLIQLEVPGLDAARCLVVLRAK
ncbi:MAG TPA: RsmG family class I SAM-dependent methyltransferase, partial [Gammaproteobacteria bacterium]|nr:RsmG family class I SAM-dependent methyltransferase [Gammaproteobacteria bacterium]